jgi:hypothetical protein
MEIKLERLKGLSYFSSSEEDHHIFELSSAKLIV